MMAALLGVMACLLAAPPLEVEIDAGTMPRPFAPLALTVPRGDWDLPEDRPLAVTIGDGRDRLMSGQLGGDPNRPDSELTLRWVHAGLPVGKSRWTVRPDPAPRAGFAWAEADGGLRLKHAGRDVLHYNRSETHHPNYPNQPRSAYIHPAWSPRGHVITGDYSPSHPHHRGLFLAYAKVRVGDREADFWNLHRDQARIRVDRVESFEGGPVSARLRARHRWEIEPNRPVLIETWDVVISAVPDGSCWLIDWTVAQQAVEAPVELVPYRYGGMAYRGPEPFVLGTLDVLTSEGHDRRRGDQKPARWVDLTGPIASGSGEYAGAMIADHPSNPSHPTTARIHPTTLPFFSYVPGHANHERRVSIGRDAWTTFRYRLLLHDGHPDRERDEATWRDFAEPPRVAVVPAGG